MCLLFALLACTGGTGADPDDSGVAGDTDDPPPTDDTGTSSTVPLTASLTGTVMDPDGNPVAGARVNVCRHVCRTITTEADGAYAFEALEAWTATYYVVPEEGSGYANPMVTLTLADGEARAIDVVLDPFDTPQGLPRVASEVEVTDGLYLTIGADNLTPPPLEDLPAEVAAVRVPAEHRLDVEVDGAVLDVWYLSPWEATSETGVAVRMDNLWGLAPGDRARAFVVSEPTAYTWLDAGELVVEEDGATLAGDASLPILTTLALVRE
ncbi:MAG: carboxypeptidase-like regulatory domain-containing protein [Myxococcota bacterium]